MATQTWHNVAVLYDDHPLDHITEETLRSLVAIALEGEGVDIEDDDPIINADHETIRRALGRVLQRDGRSGAPMFYADGQHAMRRYWQLKGMCSIMAQSLDFDRVHGGQTPEAPPVDELVALQRCIDELSRRVRKPNDKVYKAYNRKHGTMHLGKFMFWWWVCSPHVVGDMPQHSADEWTTEVDRRMLIVKLKAALVRHNEAVDSGSYSRACKAKNLCPEHDKWKSHYPRYQEIEHWYNEVNAEFHAILVERGMSRRYRGR
jgi:hypothetical protein